LVRHHQRAAALFDLQFVKPVDPRTLAGLLRDYAARLAAAR
jgi:hypothetical protein